MLFISPEGMRPVCKKIGQPQIEGTFSIVTEKSKIYRYKCSWMGRHMVALEKNSF